MGIIPTIGYGFPSLIIAAVGVAFYVFLPRFYADSLGVSLSLIGFVILISRVWDAVIDPAIGHLSDRTQSRWGRRRPWIVAATLPLAAVVYALFAPMDGLGPQLQGAWYGVLAVLFFFLSSLWLVPYDAWGAEASGTYEARTTLFAVRQGFFIVGTLVAAILPYWLFNGPAPVGQREGFALLGLLYGAGLIVSTVILILTVRERQHIPFVQTGAPASLRAGTKRALENYPFRTLLLAYIVSGFGAALPATLIEFYVPHVLGAPSSAPYLLLYFGVGVVFLPLWIWLARKFEKRLAWIASLLINAGAFLGVWMLEAGDTDLYTMLVVISAVGYGGSLAIPLSMQADVIEYENCTSGLRSEGTFMGLWSVGSKLAAALGSSVALPVLEWSGYRPNTTQGETTVQVLSFLYAGLPSLCYLGSIVIISRYPITRKVLDDLRVKNSRITEIPRL